MISFSAHIFVCCFSQLCVIFFFFFLDWVSSALDVIRKKHLEFFTVMNWRGIESHWINWNKWFHSTQGPWWKVFIWIFLERKSKTIKEAKSWMNAVDECLLSKRLLESIEHFIYGTLRHYKTFVNFGSYDSAQVKENTFILLIYILTWLSVLNAGTSSLDTTHTRLIRKVRIFIQFETLRERSEFTHWWFCKCVHIINCVVLNKKCHWGSNCMKLESSNIHTCPVYSYMNDVETPTDLK